MEHGSIITQARREDALVLTKQGLVSKSSPKKPRGRNIFKAFFCCFRTQHVGQSSSSTELSAYKEEANTIAKSDLLHCLQYQFYQIPGTCLLPEVTEEDQGRICVVIDLDETLVHSSFKPINNADFIVPVEIEGTTHQLSSPTPPAFPSEATSGPAQLLLRTRLGPGLPSDCPAALSIRLRLWRRAKPAEGRGRHVFKQADTHSELLIDREKEECLGKKG
ncbi:carboxy-terminal domain RNA polymerase II polypeptide A small phosphatase 2 isoform X3 [Neomonachus schauinslandi]|uniref:Carboxy-terminal domain RNA polymerase II polypeptide A small phosphatase 2 isoform X3 n=1 Tax=Neomonachus schauinslandi TaxID=29088 RepID=A0A2Y9H0A2_NEOSC|nr:carboxy-terminal domain RNA polymerase II polypeptide A small phosphatase 2 isoform X3 [Neomonachus schauinslandi]